MGLAIALSDGLLKMKKLNHLSQGRLKSGKLSAVCFLPVCDLVSAASLYAHLFLTDKRRGRLTEKEVSLETG